MPKSYQHHKSFVIFVFSYDQAGFRHWVINNLYFNGNSNGRIIVKQKPDL